MTMSDLVLNLSCLTSLHISSAFFLSAQPQNTLVLLRFLDVFARCMSGGNAHKTHAASWKRRAFITDASHLSRRRSHGHNPNFEECRSHYVSVEDSGELDVAASTAANTKTALREQRTPPRQRFPHYVIAPKGNLPIIVWHSLCDSVTT